MYFIQVLSVVSSQLFVVCIVAVIVPLGLQFVGVARGLHRKLALTMLQILELSPWTDEQVQRHFFLL